jgi:NADH:ubiquinone oxidoreductase subunit K
MVKIMISIEIMIFASVINFCYFAGGESIKFGHFAAMIAVVFGGIVLSIVYAIFNVEAKRNVKVNLYL